MEQRAKAKQLHVEKDKVKPKIDRHASVLAKDELANMVDKELSALVHEAEEVFSVLEQGNTNADEMLEELRKKREGIEDAEVDEVLDKRKADFNDLD